MPDQTISQMTVVGYKPGLVVPAIDMTAPSGLKNVAVTLSEIAAGGERANLWAAGDGRTEPRRPDRDQPERR